MIPMRHRDREGRRNALLTCLKTAFGSEMTVRSAIGGIEESGSSDLGRLIARRCLILWQWKT
jgi:hypothetical protein